MRTKIRSLLIICALGFVGVLNANATLSCIAGNLEEARNVKSENLNSAGFVLNEDAAIDYQMEAQLITKSIADNEEAKTIQMLIDRGLFGSNDEMVSFAGQAKPADLNSEAFVFNETADAAIDYQLEARLVTKWIADNEEAKTIQKLISNGKIAENN